MKKTCIKIAAYSLFSLAMAGCVSQSQQAPVAQVDNSNYRPVILVSIDGFKPEYLGRGVTPTLNALAKEGVRAESMRPSFPSITFPNHYTLVTGLRPDHHGIVANTMDDKHIAGVRFKMSNKEAVLDRRWWDGAEPVWVTAEKNQVRTGIMFWPGSEAAIHGVRPSAYKAFDETVTPAARVDTVLGWMEQPAATRPGFLTVYFDQVDHAGHDFGPDTKEVTAAAATVDAAIARLVDGLRARNINANIVIVSDHGMAATSPQRTIQLDKIAQPANYDVVVYGSFAGIEPRSGQEDAVATALLKPHEHMQCWKKENIPARYQYGKHPRVPRFICSADVGWLVVPDAKAAAKANSGAHGYDNLSKEMQALFIANGPAFKKATVLPAFDNVDVYPLLMKLLRVPARPSDGRIDAIQPALVQ
ncbi:ectonucleotide pyrophosphatase/phosphodiesterase [Undibacterium pigrum]|uniref:Putative AlkP superfamily pyrophosphatase or phosphodiesterase n=1 Tax=Undibacterium pigrum TaxID=401470 RepID=A0A318J7X0_9BURK|nr:ectonucleotide pyrophosphatase/phosphodiesterase [Undibacterium pigrum]PXX42649.1 putative AlkP superfamily pyrophosphatase or phosphodiesterase [Undibacterium pigrum]